MLWTLSNSNNKSVTDNFAFYLSPVVSKGVGKFSKLPRGFSILIIQWENSMNTCYVGISYIATSAYHRIVLSK